MHDVTPLISSSFHLVEGVIIYFTAALLHLHMREPLKDVIL